MSQVVQQIKIVLSQGEMLQELDQKLWVSRRELEARRCVDILIPDELEDGQLQGWIEGLREKGFNVEENPLSIPSWGKNQRQFRIQQRG